VTWFEAAWSCQNNLQSSKGKPWLDSDGVVLIDVLKGQSSARNGATIVGLRAIERQRIYHSAQGTADVAADVYQELRDGKIVILDLSVGTESVREAMSERIAKYVFASNLEAFHGGGAPPNIVLYVEEAHNLIGADAKPDETWPRIAKEGAKARIALVYATQEPSSVQRNILANTENLFCTHLNNDDEVRTLSKYYDFADFAESIKKVQDVGFARVKTLSSAFVVPTQISKFDPAVIANRLLALKAISDDRPAVRA
jgi:DNA helicase HerA-like ATPase